MHDKSVNSVALANIAWLLRHSFTNNSLTLWSLEAKGMRGKYVVRSSGKPVHSGRSQMKAAKKESYQPSKRARRMPCASETLRTGFSVDFLRFATKSEPNCLPLEEGEDAGMTEGEGAGIGQGSGTPTGGRRMGESLC